MAPPFTRASRVYKFVPAAGSSVEVKQYSASGVLQTPEPTAGVTLDIESGVLADLPINRVTTNSGGVGETQRTRTGFDWTYQLILSFPAAVIGSALAASFVQELLGGSDYVWLRFNMGDPEYWRTNGLPIRSFLGERSLMSQCEQRFDPATHDVVGLRIAGEGSSLLIAELRQTEGTAAYQAYP